jgi:hypothetical protein
MPVAGICLLVTVGDFCLSLVNILGTKKIFAFLGIKNIPFAHQ